MTDTANSRLAALRADGMTATQTGERTGSRPKPPKAEAQSASLEPGRAPGYPPFNTVASPIKGEGLAQTTSKTIPPQDRLEAGVHLLCALLRRHTGAVGG